MSFDFLTEAEETGKGNTSFKQTPRQTLLFLLLQDLNNLKLALEPYYIKKDKRLNTDREIIIIRARLKTVLFHITGILKRHFRKDMQAYDEFIRKVNSRDSADLFQAIDFIISFLDEKRLTRLDAEFQDRTRVEIEAEGRNY